jgi:hypothetical protein
MRRLLALALILVALPAAGQVVVNGVPIAPSYGVLVNGVPASTRPGSTLLVAASNARSSAGADYLCDGTADEVQISAALAALPSGGGVVQLTEGTFTLSGDTPITGWKSYAVLRGSGWGTKLTVPAAWTGAGDKAMLCIGCSAPAVVGVRIEDLWVDGAGRSSAGSFTPVEFNQYVSDSRVFNVKISNCAGSCYGLYGNYTSGLDVEHCFFTGISDSVEFRKTNRLRFVDNYTDSKLQIYAGGTGANQSRAITVQGNLFSGQDGYLSITDDSGTIVGLSVVGNTFYHAGTNSNGVLNLKKITGLVVSGNIIDEAGVTLISTPAIVLDSTVSDYLIADNYLKTGYNNVSGLGQVAIKTDGTDGVIKGNRIDAPYPSNIGIQTTAAVGLTVRGNRINGTALAADTIGVDIAGSTGVEVDGNWFSNLATGVKAATSTGVRIHTTNRYDSVIATVADTSTSPEPYGIAATGLVTIRKADSGAETDLDVTPAVKATGNLFCLGIATPCNKFYVDKDGTAYSALGFRHISGNFRLTSSELYSYGAITTNLGVILATASNGATAKTNCIAELTTIAAAAYTDTAMDLPASSTITAVMGRVVTVIPTATTFTVGDPTTAARFASGVAVAAGTTFVGLAHRQPSVADAAGPVQVAAAKVRITPDSSPAAATGQVRVVLCYEQFTAPTS